MVLCRDDRTRLGAVGVHQVIEMSFNEDEFDIATNMAEINRLVDWMMKSACLG